MVGDSLIRPLDFANHSHHNSNGMSGYRVVGLSSCRITGSSGYRPVGLYISSCRNIKRPLPKLGSFLIADFKLSDVNMLF